ncbi:MAG: 30S ribosomal protein S16 [Bacilli bacterium]
MAVKLRLKRMGAKGKPFYRIVAADARVARDGKYLEEIGTYNPMMSENNINIKKEIAIKWLKQGAQPTNTVKSLLSRTGVLTEYHNEKYNK